MPSYFTLDNCIGTPAVVGLTDPAAGANFAVYAAAQPTMICALFFRLVTAAAVATRTAVVSITTAGGLVLFTQASSVTQAASLTRDYSWSQGIPVVTNPGLIVYGLPLPQNFILQTGWRLAITITNIQAADQLSLGNLITRDWRP